jgi:thymidylate synthase (FAD)
MVKLGHWSVLEFGTLYFKIPVGELSWVISILVNPDRPESRGSRVILKGQYYYVTTNFRVREQLWYDAKSRKDREAKKEVLALGRYLTKPDMSIHKLRVNTHWISSIAVSNQAFRGRVFSQMQESQRYCNYSKDKFGGELTFIMPHWVYEKEAKLHEDLDLKKEANELWCDLIKVSKKCKRRDDFWKGVEEEYLEEIKDGMLPEEARDVLDKQTKTEFYLCGFLDDWFYEPPRNSPEKAGFFSLRTAKAAQGDIRDLATELEKMMIVEYVGPNFKYQIFK